MKTDKGASPLLIQEIFISLAVIGVVFSCSVYSVIVSALGRQDLNDKILKWWGETCVRLTKVQLEVKGLEHLPPGGAIFVFNHMSLLDIILIYAGLPKSIRFGAKAELFKIPIFGQAMKVVGTLPIERQDKAGTLSAYSQSTGRIKKGQSFALAPEGTRQVKPGIGEFKSGPFMLAIEAQAPLIPVVIKGAEKLLSKAAWVISLRGDRKVTIEILPAISTVGLTREDRKNLRDQTRVAMQAAYSQLPSSAHHL